VGTRSGPPQPGRAARGAGGQPDTRLVPIRYASYLGTGDAFDQAIADFSAAYADQNERDYDTFAAAVNSGRLAARTGV
jgi:hypothetical protein